MKRLLLSVALLASAFSSSGGQSLSTLPRATVPTGLNDSTLVYVSDSAKRSRAAVAPDFRKMLSLRAFDSLATASLRLPGTLNLTGGSITGSPSATLGAITVSSCSGCAPAVVDSATGAARAQKLTTARTINGTSFDGTANVTVTAAAGTLSGATLASGVTASSLTSFGAGARTDSTTGAARSQILTTARTIGGTSFNGSANIVPGLSDSATGANRAQILTTARTIGGTSFNGSANIVPGLSDSATGATRAQKLTTARTIGGVSFDGTANILPDSAVGAARASALVGSPAITVSSCTGCGGGATVSDTVRAVTFDSVRTARLRADTIRSRAGASQRLVVQTTTSGSALATAARFNEAQQSLFTDGTISRPGIAYSSDTTMGWYRAGANEMNLAMAGNNVVRIANPGGSEVLEFRPGGSTRFNIMTTQMTKSVQMQGENGSATSPTYGFTNSTTTGFYRFGADTIGVANAGAVTSKFTSAGIAVPAGSQSFASLAVGEAGTGLYRSSVGILALTAGNTRRLDVSSSGINVYGNLFSNVAGSAVTPAFALNSGTMGLYTIGASTDTLGISTSSNLSVGIRGGASPTIFGGAGSMTIQAGTGASRRLVLQTTTSGSTATTALRFNEVQQSLFADGSTARPSITFANDSTVGWFRTGTLAAAFASGGSDRIRYDGAGTLNFRPAGAAAMDVTTSGASIINGSSTTPSLNFLFSTGTGMYRFGADTIGFATNGVAAWRISYAGATNQHLEPIQANSDIGTTAKRVRHLRFSGQALGGTGAGCSGNAPSFSQEDANGAGVCMLSDTTVVVTGGVKRLLVATNAATGAGDVAVCLTTANVITKGATCGTSSAKAKTAFGSIFNPVEKTMALRPSSYSYIPGMYGGRHEYGLIADSTMAVDTALVFRAETDQLLPNGQTIRKGDALNVNDRAVLSLLIATVQQQQRSIDSLRVELSKVKKP